MWDCILTNVFTLYVDFVFLLDLYLDSKKNDVSGLGYISQYLYLANTQILSQLTVNNNKIASFHT